VVKESAKYRVKPRDGGAKGRETDTSQLAKKGREGGMFAAKKSQKGAKFGKKGKCKGVA